MQYSPQSVEPDNVALLFQSLLDHFSAEELKSLAFDLTVDFEDLPASGREGKARELVLHLSRTERLPELVDAIADQRPHVDREEITRKFRFETLSEALAFLFSEEELKTLSAIELGIDYEDLPALGKANKAQELVCELKRRGQLPELLKLCQEKRPQQENWDQLAVSCPRFSRKQIIALVTAGAFLVAVALFWAWWPPPMADGFNVVVAEFGLVDENGRVQRSDLGEGISRALLETIENEIKQLPPTMRVQLRDVGVVKGADRGERATAAAKIADRHNATMLIYGVISINESESQIELEFFVPDESFGYGSEMAGPNRLGKPVPLDTTLDAARQFELNEKLDGRRQALQNLVKGLANYFFGRYENAYADFDWVTGIPEWANVDGKEVVYLLMGAARFQAYNVEEMPYQLESAQDDFTEARDINGQYARSYLGLGAVLLTKLENMTNPDDIATELARAEGLYLTALIMPDQPELAHIPIKASNGLGELYWRGRQKGVTSWPGQNAAELLNCTAENDNDYVVEVGKCAFNQVLDQYEAKGQPSDLKWLVAHAHAKLGILAGYEADWPTMIAESRQAIQMLEELPRDVVLVNQGWIARYWAQIGVAHELQGQMDDAHAAYQNAIRIGANHVSDEEIIKWEEAKKKLEEGS